MYTKEIINRIHQKLPPDLLEAIASEKTLDTINSLAIAHNLSVDQMNKLSVVLTWRLMGLINKGNITSTIQTEVGVNQEIATKIEESLFKEIISTIKGDLLRQRENDTKIILTQSSNNTLVKDTHPMIEPGEVAHEVPHTEFTINNEQLTKEQERTKVSLPDYRYEGGKDPYREPLK